MGHPLQWNRRQGDLRRVLSLLLRGAPPGSDDPGWSCHDCSVVGFSLNVVNDTVGVLECPYENSDTIIDDVTTLYPDIFVNSNTLDTEVALDICTDYCE
mmetsp:Transcript_23076/g.71882  ORF Transcript_23076/g.71882 Transcript_23076/m.71882 type:complete len:99 (-) Transcript_23076:433-729(-)